MEFVYKQIREVKQVFLCKKLFVKSYRWWIFSLHVCHISCPTCT